MKAIYEAVLESLIAVDLEAETSQQTALKTMAGLCISAPRQPEFQLQVDTAVNLARELVPTARKQWQQNKAMPSHKSIRGVGWTMKSLFEAWIGRDTAARGVERAIDKKRKQCTSSDSSSILTRNEKEKVVKEPQNSRNSFEAKGNSTKRKKAPWTAQSSSKRHKSS